MSFKLNENIILRVKGISKSFDYGNTYTPKNINFELTKEDRITFLLGQNGSGKTILLKIITKEDLEFSGSIDYSEDFFHNIAIQYQENGLIPNLTVLNNLNIVSKNLDAIEKAFKTLDFSIELIRKRVEKLSGGEYKQVQIVRNVLSNRSIWICDEPTASMDKEIIDKLINYIERNIEFKQFIIASHDLYFINELKRCISKKINEISL